MQIAKMNSPPPLSAPRTIQPPSFSPSRLLSQFWRLTEYWDLLLTLSLHRIRIRYKQSLLGGAWAVFQPLSLMIIYTIIFSKVARMPSEGAPYAIFVYVAMLPWNFFAASLTSASNSLVSHNSLITKVYFPREVLPLSYLVATSIDFLIGVLVLIPLFVWFQMGVTLHVLWVIPLMALAAAFVFSLSMILATIQVYFRDIGLALPLLLQLWMFASPVVYPLSAVPERFQAWFVLNPMAGIVDGVRRCVLHGASPDFHSLRISLLTVLLLLPVAYGFFKHKEASMADVI